MQGDRKNFFTIQYSFKTNLENLRYSKDKFPNMISLKSFKIKLVKFFKTLFIMVARESDILLYPHYESTND
jgi:hypothetical protein